MCLASPNGALQKFDPVTGQTTVVSTDMPSDPRNQQGRLNNVDPNANPKDDPVNTIICGELFRQGLMDINIFNADAKFGKMILKKEPKVIIGYHFIARPIVYLMRKSKLVTIVVNRIAQPWSYEMAYSVGQKSEGSKIGKIIMFFGIPFCYFIGLLIETKLIWLVIVILISLLSLIRLKLTTRMCLQKKILLLPILIMILFFFPGDQNFAQNHKIVNWSLEKDGYVSNEETAIKIAEAVWLVIYGDAIYNHKPFKAILEENDIWIVKTTLKKGMVGGTTYAKIRKKTGEIVDIYHTK